MGRGLTAGALVGIAALLIYIFTKQGREVGDRGFSYLGNQLASLRDGDDDEADKRTPAAGETGTPEPEVEPNVRPVAPVEPEGPPVDPNTGAGQRGTVTIIDDDPQPGAQPKSEAPRSVVLSGQSYKGAPVIDVRQIPRGVQTSLPRSSPTSGRAFDIDAFRARAQAAAASPQAQRSQAQNAQARESSRTLTNKWRVAVGRDPIPRATALAPSTAQQAQPREATPTRASAPNLNARVQAAAQEGARQAQAPGRAGTRRPAKASLYQTPDEIHAKLAAYRAVDQQRRGVA